MDNMEIEQKLIELEKRIKNIEFEQLDSAGEFQKLAQEVIQARESNSKLLESKYKSNDFLMKENQKYAHVADDRYIEPSKYLIDTAKEHIEGKLDIKDVEKRINSYYNETEKRNKEEN